MYLIPTPESRAEQRSAGTRTRQSFRASIFHLRACCESDELFEVHLENQLAPVKPSWFGTLFSCELMVFDPANLPWCQTSPGGMPTDMIDDEEADEAPCIGMWLINEYDSSESDKSESVSNGEEDDTYLYDEHPARGLLLPGQTRDCVGAVARVCHRDQGE